MTFFNKQNRICQNPAFGKCNNLLSIPPPQNTLKKKISVFKSYTYIFMGFSTNLSMPNPTRTCKFCSTQCSEGINCAANVLQIDVTGTPFFAFV